MWAIAVHTNEGNVPGCLLWKLVVVKCVKKSIIVSWALRSTQQVPDLPQPPLLGSFLSTSVIWLSVIYPILLCRWPWVDHPCVLGMQDGNSSSHFSCNQEHVSKVFFKGILTVLGCLVDRFTSVLMQSACWKSTSSLFVLPHLQPPGGQ